ncbi:MAG: hypothetical protein ACKOX6_16820 [Bdellovibrio sp.]
MSGNIAIPSKEDLEIFKNLIEENRYDFCKLVFLIFPFGQPGHELEHKMPYKWQMEEWAKLSKHLSNPETRHEAYRLIVSSGNGAAKTSFGAMTFFMLMYTQRVRGRITANTLPQLNSVVWPEYDIWYRHARYADFFFEKFGTSIKARQEGLSETWRLDAVTWNESTPASISGLHNKGGAILYIFEEAPGIPAIIWNYASGAMTDTDTIKVWLAFGNSDDPESKFEQNMTSPDWHPRRIDTRTMDHVDPKQIEVWLRECGGDENHDDFRVRVRGLPRKSSKDSIISNEIVETALERRHKFDIATVDFLPCIIACDPAWTGGDETTIWYKQGNYAKLLEKFKLDKATGEDHRVTYNKMVEWEKTLKGDAVNIDQAEGTALKTLANQAGKDHWQLISFAGSPYDALEFKDSEFANIRAQMYYEGKKWLMDGGVLDAREEEWIDVIKRQLCWTKGTRHKTNLKKLAESKDDIKARVGQSPDVADGFVLLFGRSVLERHPDNERTTGQERVTGNAAYSMPDNYDPYADIGGGYDVYG